MNPMRQEPGALFTVRPDTPVCGQMTTDSNAGWWVLRSSWVGLHWNLNVPKVTRFREESFESQGPAWGRP